MKCPDCNAWLQTWLDSRQAGLEQAPPEVQEHLRECRPCREQLGLAQLLVQGVKKLPVATPPAGLSRRIVDQALSDRADARRRLLRRFRFTMALAASILIMVVVGYVIVPKPHPDQGKGGPIAKEMPKVKEAPVVKVEDARGKVAALTEKVAGKT